MRNSTVINVKIEPALKRQSQKVANELGLNLSSLIKGILRQLVDSKEVVLRVSEQPSDFLIKSLKEAQADIKAGRVVSFDNPHEALAYLNKIESHGRKHRQN